MSISNLFVPNAYTMYFNIVKTTQEDTLILESTVTTSDNTPTFIGSFTCPMGRFIIYQPSIIGRNLLNNDLCFINFTLSTDGTNANTTLLNSNVNGIGTMAGCNYSYSINDLTKTISVDVIGLVGINATWKLMQQAFTV